MQSSLLGLHNRPEHMSVLLCGDKGGTVQDAVERQLSDAEEPGLSV
jgi:hypothetical protein